MKIGIMIHSNTGNTYSVAEKLRDKLIKDGHFVDLDKLEPVGGENTNETDIKKIIFDKQPDLSKYDALVFGGPVRGFSISPVLSAYLSLIPSLKNKKVSILVTEHFPYPWMGGNHTIGQIKKICESKGATIIATGVVNWKNKRREEKIVAVVDNLSKF